MQGTEKDMKVTGQRRGGTVRILGGERETLNKGGTKKHKRVGTLFSEVAGKETLGPTLLTSVEGQEGKQNGEIVGHPSRQDVENAEEGKG